MFDLRKIAIAVLALGAVSIASAQVSIDYEDSVAATADGVTLATMSVDWTNDVTVGSGGISSLQMEMTLPSGVTLAACNAGADLGGDHSIAVCDDGTSGPGSFTISWFSLSNALLPDGEIATLDFTVAPGTGFGTLPIGLTDLTDSGLNSMADTSGTEITIDPGTNFNGDGGSLEVSCPVGESCYASTPLIGANVDFGSAVVNQTTADQVISVSNLQDDAATTFDITAASGTNGGATIGATVPGGTATVPADGGATEVDVTFDCTPLARGDQTGTLAIDNDSDNAGPSAGYDYTCAGESPNVQVPAGPVSLNGTVPAADPSDTITVTNPQDGFTSTANNLTATAAGDPQITVSGGPTNLAPDGSFGFTVSCDSSAEGNFSGTIDFTWDDPVGPGADSVNVDCTVSDVAPGYTSDPAVPGPLAFGQIQNGDSSTLTIDIGNEDSIGSGTGAELDITGAVLSDATNYSFAPDPFTATLAESAPNGTESLDVTCNPQSIGDFSGETLTVQTNDGDQVYNLTCEGTSNAGFEVTPSGALDGTLNLGSVPPDTSAGGSLTISNTGTDPLDVSCTLTDDNGGVIVFDPAPAFPVSIPPDLTISFQGTPPEVATFTETLECTVTDPSDPGAEETFTTTVSVSGRPLVIPTMSRWGLVVMSLVLLLVAGFAGRRMMA